MQEFLSFRRLQTLDEAHSITALLEQHAIPFEIMQDEGPAVPQHFMGQRFDSSVIVKIPGDCFKKANDLLQQAVTINLDTVEPDYYLLSFTDDELTDIIKNPDEWGEYDYALAQELLKKRGITYTDRDLTSFKQEKLSQLIIAEPGKPIWIVLGYILAVMGAVLGLVIGYNFMRGNKTLPDGRRVYAYTRATRDHGITMFAIGLVEIVIGIIYKVFVRE